jgi:hypothetical protein
MAGTVIAGDTASYFRFDFVDKGFAMRTLVRLAVGIALIVILAAVTVAQRPTVRPVASVLQLMEAMVGPSADALFHAAAVPPRDAPGWVAVRNHAVIVAEAGNLLMVGSRAKAEDAWMELSHAMVEAGALALKAAEARDAQTLEAAGNLIVDICEQCHALYVRRGP